MNPSCGPDLTGRSVLNRRRFVGCVQRTDSHGGWGFGALHASYGKSANRPGGRIPKILHGRPDAPRVQGRKAVGTWLALVTLAPLLLATPPALPAQEPARRPETPAPSLFPEGYADDAALAAALKHAAEAYPKALRVESLGKSLRGRDLWMATVGHARPGTGAGTAPPAILVVANLEADHVVGSQVALGLVERLAAADGRDPAISALLDRCTIHVIPRLNPDGVERLLKSPRGDFRANLRPMDRDRDGRSNEDGPDDLDGDGLITRMRVRDAKATQVADEKDPRLARRADPAKGERAAFREFSEGLDDDGDGRLNEDPDGGVDLNRNWPHRWTEFDPEAGAGPASEPEVRALIHFAFDHPEIAVLWSFGLNDNLAAPSTTVDDADKPLFAELSRLFNGALAAARRDAPAGAEANPPPATRPAVLVSRPRLPALQRGRRRAAPPANEGAQGAPPAIAATTDGALSEWAYHQYGVIGLASRLWLTPEVPAPPPGQPAPPGDGEARWLYWNDRVMGGRAFVPFAPFDHPTLGRVEVGGWKPGVRLNPPAARLDPIADAHFAFLKDLAARLPALAIAEAKAEPKGAGVFEVTATIANSGGFPTALAQGVRTRKAPPVLVRLKPGKATLLAGRALTKIDALAGSGGRQEFRWLVLAPEGGAIVIEAASAKAGSAEARLDLKPGP